MTIAFERFREALHSTGSQVTNNKQNHFMAQCPAHEDRNPSLSVDCSPSGVLVKCHAGCHTDDVVASIGLTLADLFDAEPDEDRAVPVRSYVYRRSNGEPWIVVDRYFPKSFRQRLPGTEVGDKSGLKGRAPILYNADKVWRAIQSGEAVVWLVEGEKDVETCERHGLVATCTLGGAGKRWLDSYTRFLRNAKQVIVVVDQDVIKPNGTLGAGQQHGIQARHALKGAGVPVKVVAPAVGKDATDHFTAGYGPEDFVPEPTVYVRPRGLKASELAGREFEPVKFAVDRLLPSGLTIFAGSPKAGKSWCVLDISMAVAAGGRALSELAVTQGSVLYLAREDNYRRLQSRMHVLTGGDMNMPEKLELIPMEQDWPSGTEALAHLSEWAEEVGDPTLVVFDTLAKVEPEMGEDRSRGAYAGNYAMMSRYKEWADQHNCALLMVHHDRKGAVGSKQEFGMESDPFSRISGTRGLTGAADTLWFLDKIRGTQEGFLHVTGRDVVEQTVEMRKVGPTWVALDRPE